MDKISIPRFSAHLIAQLGGGSDDAELGGYLASDPALKEYSGSGGRVWLFALRLSTACAKAQLGGGIDERELGDELPLRPLNP